ncbi:hypothetical protein P280DRAFT_118420 [Massarina eburnea CBS 473.64]|uniref:Uncharacterized protein n=1 Tax=Massarina eburnea CBS 473.64 TaxID=1395130 RepID=A0A6A6SCU2_9PLEO|nr:hypothetical protein P280DRAFT_118420 [Massarina eburnea CBS 473.64]
MICASITQLIFFLTSGAQQFAEIGGSCMCMLHTNRVETGSRCSSVRMGDVLEWEKWKGRKWSEKSEWAMSNGMAGSWISMAPAYTALESGGWRIDGDVRDLGFRGLAEKPRKANNLLAELSCWVHMVWTPPWSAGRRVFGWSCESPRVRGDGRPTSLASFDRRRQVDCYR